MSDVRDRRRKTDVEGRMSEVRNPEKNQKTLRALRALAVQSPLYPFRL